MTTIRSRQQWVSLNKLRKQGILCDVKFYTENDIGQYDDSGVAAHSSVLVASSPIFYSKLVGFASSASPEGVMKMTVSVPHVSPAVWELVLDYIYAKKASITNTLPKDTVASFVNILSELKLVSEADFENISKYCENELDLDDIASAGENDFELNVNAFIDDVNNVSNLTHDTSYDDYGEDTPLKDNKVISLSASGGDNSVLLQENKPMPILVDDDNDDDEEDEEVEDETVNNEVNHNEDSNQDEVESDNEETENHTSNGDVVEDSGPRIVNMTGKDKIGKDVSLDLTKATYQQVVYCPLDVNGSGLITGVIQQQKLVDERERPPSYDIDRAKKREIRLDCDLTVDSFLEKQRKTIVEPKFTCETCGKKFLMGGSLSKHIKGGCNPLKTKIGGIGKFHFVPQQPISHSTLSLMKLQFDDLKNESGLPNEELNMTSNVINSVPQVLEIISNVKQEPVSDVEDQGDNSESQFDSSLFEEHNNSSEKETTNVVNTSIEMNTDENEDDNFDEFGEIVDSSNVLITGSEYNKPRTHKRDMAGYTTKAPIIKTEPNITHYIGLKGKISKDDAKSAYYTGQQDLNPELFQYANLAAPKSIKEFVALAKLKRLQTMETERNDSEPIGALPAEKKQRGRPVGRPVGLPVGRPVGRPVGQKSSFGPTRRLGRPAGSVNKKKKKDKFGSDVIKIKSEPIDDVQDNESSNKYGNVNMKESQDDIDTDALDLDDFPSNDGDSDGSEYVPDTTDFQLLRSEAKVDTAFASEMKGKKKRKKRTPKYPPKPKKPKLIRPVYKTLKNNNVCNLCGKTFIENTREKIVHHQK